MKYKIEELTWWEVATDQKFLRRTDLWVTFTDDPYKELEGNWSRCDGRFCYKEQTVLELLRCDKRWKTLKDMDGKLFDIDEILSKSNNLEDSIIAKMYYEGYFDVDLIHLKYDLPKDEYKKLEEVLLKKYNKTHRSQIKYDAKAKEWFMACPGIEVFDGKHFADAVDRCERFYGSIEKYNYILAFQSSNFMFKYIGDDEDFVIEDEYDYDRAFEMKELIWYAVPDPKYTIYIIDLKAPSPYDYEDYENEDYDDEDYE